MIKKPKIRKFNKKLKKIDDEESIYELEEQLLIKHNLDNKVIRKLDKW